MASAAELVKNLSTFSTDTLEYVLKSLAGEEYENLRHVLETAKNDLTAKTSSPQSATKATKSPKNLPPPAQVFTHHVVPQLTSGLSQYEIKEDKWMSVSVSLDFKRNYSSLTDTEKIKAHSEMLKQEGNCEALMLYIKRERGLLYLQCIKERTRDENVSDWFRSTLGVVYQRAQECMNFAHLTTMYPRLLVCGIKWTQFLKHNKRIISYVAANPELKERLERPIAVQVQGKDIMVEEPTAEDGIEAESELLCTNFKYDADNHILFPTEESQDEDAYDWDDDEELCNDLSQVGLDDTA